MQPFVFVAVIVHGYLFAARGFYYWLSTEVIHLFVIHLFECVSREGNVLGFIAAFEMSTN